jgi:DNA invertase Pin-like site-specific DNA recombinase
MLAGFATFERDLIRERQREGIAITKLRGRTKDERGP